MPKESFKQPIKKEPSIKAIKEMEKKLDKAEKMIEEVEKRLKTEEVEKKIEEFIEKPVEELKRLWEEDEKELRAKTWSEIFSFFSSLPLPEVPFFLLERISNKFLKEFDWKKFEGRKYLKADLGLFLSAFLKKNTENYILSQIENYILSQSGKIIVKGIKEENIKPIEVHLNVKELPVCLSNLGYRNPKKLHLIIKGNCGDVIGNTMQGGKIIIEGNCEYFTGIDMQGGKIIVTGNCGHEIGRGMKGGELNIKGEVKSFDKSAFSPNNQGTIILGRTKIWENGNWTKEGREMWEKGEIPVK